MKESLQLRSVESLPAARRGYRVCCAAFPMARWERRCGRKGFFAHRQSLRPKGTQPDKRRSRDSGPSELQGARRDSSSSSGWWRQDRRGRQLHTRGELARSTDRTWSRRLACGWGGVKVRRAFTQTTTRFHAWLGRKGGSLLQGGGTRGA